MIIIILIILNIILNIRIILNKYNYLRITHDLKCYYDILAQGDTLKYILKLI